MVTPGGESRQIRRRYRYLLNAEWLVRGEARDFYVIQVMNDEDNPADLGVGVRPRSSLQCGQRVTAEYKTTHVLDEVSRSTGTTRFMSTFKMIQVGIHSKVEHSDGCPLLNFLGDIATRFCRHRDQIPAPVAAKELVPKVLACIEPVGECLVEQWTRRRTALKDRIIAQQRRSDRRSPKRSTKRKYDERRTQLGSSPELYR